MLLTTDRLVLRRFRLDDAMALAAYRSIPEVARYQSWSAPYSLEKAHYAVQTMVAAEPTMPGWFQYAVELAEDKTLIGDVGVNLADNLMQAEIGYTLRPDHQGHGYATEAAGELMRLAFADLGVRRVTAAAFADNLPSLRIMERLGMRQESHSVKDSLHRDLGWIDGTTYAVRVDEWEPGATGG